MDEIFTLKLNSKKLAPFETFKININDILKSSVNERKLIEESNYGEIDCKIKLEGLKATFPRLLFVTTAKTDPK